MGNTAPTKTTPVQDPPPNNKTPAATKPVTLAKRRKIPNQKIQMLQKDHTLLSYYIAQIIDQLLKNNAPVPESAILLKNWLLGGLNWTLKSNLIMRKPPISKNNDIRKKKKRTSKRSNKLRWKNSREDRNSIVCSRSNRDSSSNNSSNSFSISR